MAHYHLLHGRPEVAVRVRRVHGQRRRSLEWRRLVGLPAAAAGGGSADVLHLQLGLVENGGGGGRRCVGLEEEAAGAQGADDGLSLVGLNEPGGGLGRRGEAVVDRGEGVGEARVGAGVGQVGRVHGLVRRLMLLLLPEGEGPWLLAGRPLPRGGRHGGGRGHGGRCSATGTGSTVHLLAAEDEGC
uniref:Uncharacterized protein n=1 Tax=Triticum urartu TaxID=4572 RepID=A0A8R7R2G1_TRIUA